MAPIAKPPRPLMQQRAITLASEVTAGRLPPMTRVTFREELLAAQLGKTYAPGRPKGFSYTKWYELSGSSTRENAGEYDQYEQQATGTVVWHRFGAGKAPQRFAKIAADIKLGRRSVPSREEFLSEGLQMETNVSGLLEGIYALFARRLNWDTYVNQSCVSDYLNAAPNRPAKKQRSKAPEMTAHEMTSHESWLTSYEFWKKLQAIFPPEWRESANAVRTRIMTYHPGAVSGFQIVEVMGHGETARVSIKADQKRYPSGYFIGYYELTLTKVRTRTEEILSLAVRERVGDRPGHKAGRNETGHYLTPS